MHSLSHKKKRFSLLFLEDGEIYAKDSLCTRYHPDSYPEKRQEKGRIHICTRSIIFEPLDSETRIVRYSYRDMEKYPEEVQNFKVTGSPGNYSKLAFSIQKVTELPETRSPGPYKTIQYTSGQQVFFEISFDKTKEIIDLVQKLCTKNRKNSAGFDQDVYLESTKTKIEEEQKFDTSRIESVSEKPLITNLKVQRIHPYTQIKGYLYMTDVRIYFQPIHQVSAHPVKSVKYSEISKLYKRRWRLRNLGFEFFTKSEKSVFLAFSAENERDKTFEQLLRFVSPECQTENSVENMMLKWQLKVITNYEYLLYLNSAAYRTFSDFTQYPVFPWVLQNYESSELDLSDPSNFRDLSKPVGALNQSRLESFHKLFNEMPEPKFLYGTHYSTPAHVIGFLFRKFPLAMLRLHSGKFDAPDRLFDDIGQDWKCVLDSPADVKELIPEFYGVDPSFLINENNLDLGVKSNGEKVADVKLPPWASGAQDFLLQMRASLESDYVSENLHHWIDLIFGYKQRGEAASESDNCIIYVVFHPLTYEGSIDLDSISDPLERQAVELQISEFGQTPKQLFKIPHPPRPSNEIIELPRTLHRQTSLWSVEAIARKKTAEVAEVSLHKKRISSINIVNDKVFTTGHDGCLKILTDGSLQKRSFTVCTLPISSCCIVDDKQVTVGCYDNNLYVFNAGIGRVSHTIKAHEDAVSGVQFLNDLNLVASVSWDSLMKFWDLRNLQLNTCPVEYFDDHEDQILCMCRQDFLITTCDKSGRVVCRDFRHGVLDKFELHERIDCVGQSKHSKHLIIGTKQFLSLYETSGNLVTRLDLPQVSCFISDGVFIVNGQEEGNLQMWEFMNGENVHRWTGVRNVTALQTDDSTGSFYAGNKEGSLFIIP